MYFVLNDKSKKSIERRTGISVQEMISMDAVDIDNTLEKKARKKFKYLIKIGNVLISRGSVYLFLQRLIPMGRIDKKLSKI